VPFETAAQAEDFIFSSYMSVESRLTGPDAQTRTPALTRRLLDSLGEPDYNFTSILVTGSKGKGSIAFLTARLLQALGYRVGLVTSPHLLNFRERIRLDGRAIPEADLVRLVNRLEVPAREIIDALTDDRYLSPTGLIIAVASLYFSEQEVDFAVIEAGRGGRYDDCVVLDNPLALFGPVLLEHSEKLGDTLSDIAANKVALLKKGGVGISVPQAAEVQTIMEAWSYQVGGGFVLTGRDLRVIEPQINEGKLQAAVQGRYNLFEDLRLAIPALYEAENLAVALGAIEVIRDEQELQPYQKRYLQEALADLVWPGRMHILAGEPFTVLDGTVARQSARSVLDSLAGRWQPPLAAIVGIPADKDWQGVLQELAPYCDQLILTQAANPRLKFPAEAAAYARAIFPAGTSIEEAPNLAAARALLANRPQPVKTLLILGTQSLVADTLREYHFDLEQI
jgi:dihydrofolate synthase / folylpolyglutamate synthase